MFSGSKPHIKSTSTNRAFVGVSRSYFSNDLFKSIVIINIISDSHPAAEFPPLPLLIISRYFPQRVYYCACGVTCSILLACGMYGFPCFSIEALSRVMRLDSAGSW